MTKNYLDILAETIRNNWDQPALTDFYLTEDGNAHDTSRGNHYTYGEMYGEIVRVANLLTNLGLHKGDHIAICGANSSHWVIAYLAIAKMQGVSVSVMHSLQPEEIAHLVAFSDAKALFVDKELWGELKEKSLPQVESVIALDDFGVLRGKQISNLQSSISNQDCQFPHQKPDNLAMICFTSGSSGQARGVMHSIHSISSGVRGSINSIDIPLDQPKKYVSLLPLSHAFEFMADFSHLVINHHVYYPHIRTQSDIIKVLEHVKPYMLITVPAVVENMYQVQPDLFQTLLQNSIKEIIVGGALLNENLEGLLERNGMPVVSLYGSTEGLIFSGSKIGNIRRHSCGIISEGLSACISPNGEILVKGENVMLGYYKDPEATAAKIDKDGWLHTGDKGHLDEDGYLYVEGRLEEDIIVLPNGENIRPDNIEALINALPEVSESIVLARDGRLVAVVVPQIPNLQFPISNADLRRKILRQINPQLPLFSQLYDVEITDQPLARTEKQTLKRYLYK